MGGAFGNLAQNSTKTVHATSGSAIKFTASGEPNTAVSVSFSTATLANGGASMTFTPEVTGYASDVQGSSTAITSGNSVTLDATTGSYYLWAGGAVTAGAAQATGAYSGTWTLTVAYTGI